VSPEVASTSKRLFLIARRETSKVPPPRIPPGTLGSLY